MDYMKTYVRGPVELFSIGTMPVVPTTIVISFIKATFKNSANMKEVNSLLLPFLQPICDNGIALRWRTILERSSCQGISVFVCIGCKSQMRMNMRSLQILYAAIAMTRAVWPEFRVQLGQGQGDIQCWQQSWAFARNVARKANRWWYLDVIWNGYLGCWQRMSNCMYPCQWKGRFSCLWL